MMSKQGSTLSGEWADPFLYGPYESPEDNRVTLPSGQYFGTGHASMARFGDG